MSSPRPIRWLYWLLCVLVVIGFVAVFAGMAFAEPPDQWARWTHARLDPKRSIELDKAVALYARLAPRYQSVEKMRQNGVPAPVIFCLHYRESSNDFSCSPAQGDPLTHRSRNVPAGRIPGEDPPYTWERCALDAYYVMDRLDLPDWRDTQSALWAMEKFNGSGYATYHPDVPSPYLWAASSLYSRGKYTGDGRFDRFAVDRQLGAAAILLRMKERGVDLPF